MAVQTRSRKAHVDTANGSSSISRTSDQPLNSSTAELLIYNFVTRTAGPLFLLFLTPNLVMWLWYTVMFHDGSFVDFFSAAFNSSNPVEYLTDSWSRVTVASPLSVGVIGGYMLFQIILMLVIPGPRVEGPMTPTGHTPVYVDNGFRIYVITMAVFSLLSFYLKMFTIYSPSIVYDRFGDFLATLNIFSAIFCVFLYIKGIFAPSSTDHGASGNFIFDYWWGTELYPRILGIDIKVRTVSECVRPTFFSLDSRGIRRRLGTYN